MSMSGSFASEMLKSAGRIAKTSNRAAQPVTLENKELRDFGNVSKQPLDITHDDQGKMLSNIDAQSLGNIELGLSTPLGVDSGQARET